MVDREDLYEKIRVKAIEAREPDHTNWKRLALNAAHEICRDDLSSAECCLLININPSNVPEDVASCIPAMAATKLISEMEDRVRTEA
jgi:hypothetical protein